MQVFTDETTELRRELAQARRDMVDAADQIRHELAILTNSPVQIRLRSLASQLEERARGDR